MTKAHKIIKYFALALAIGIILNIVYGGFFIFHQIGNFLGDVTHNENEVLNNKTEFNNDEISSLKINLAYAQLEILSGDKFTIESNSNNISWKQSGKTIVITEKNHNWFFKNKKSKLVIHIPHDKTFEKVDIGTGVGNINIETFNSKNISFEIGVGKVQIDSLNITGSANIEGDVGEVKILSGKINNLDLEVGVGKFEMNAKLTGNNDIEAGVGNLSIKLADDIENYTIKAEKGIGSINVNGTEIKENIPYGNGSAYINIDGGIGSIDIK